jgi:hypothetical protein
MFSLRVVNATYDFSFFLSQNDRTHNHTLLSHLRVPQPAGSGSRIYIPQEPGGPVVPPGIWFPLRRLLRLVSDDLQGYGGGI